MSFAGRRPRAALRALAQTAVLGWLALLAGCAGLGAARDQQAPSPAADAVAAQAPATAASAPSPAASATATPSGEQAPPSERPIARLIVQAPEALRDLLAEHMDLARPIPVGAAQGDALTDEELQRLIDVAPAQARTLLATEGYFEPKVEVERTGTTNEGQPIVRVVVTPGPRVIVRDVRIDFSGPLQEQADAGDARAAGIERSLRAQWSLPVGAPFRNEDWSAAKTGILTRLRAQGYVAAVPTETLADIDPQAAAAHLLVDTESGPLYRIGALDIDPLLIHQRHEVVDMLALPAGAPLTEVALLDAQDRLIRSGLFDLASVQMQPDAARPEETPIRVRLTERSRHQVVFGIGADSNTGPRTTMEHTWRRAFGWPATLVQQIELGRERRLWRGDLSTHPDVKGERWRAGGLLERYDSGDEVVAQQSMRFGRSRETLRIDRYVYAELLHSKRTTATTQESATAATANIQWVTRQIDDMLLPTRGYTLALQGALGAATTTGSLSGTFGPFTRTWGRLTLYRPFGPWYGQWRVELGYIGGRQSLAIPDALLFRAGGDSSVRGYAYRSLGPTRDGVIYGGRALMTTSVEIARPILASMPALLGAVFVDGGNAAQTFADLRPVWGAGFGVRYRSPVGPLRVDLAYGEAVRRVRLHFSVGVVF